MTARPPVEDFYSLLGIPSSATAKEIKEAFRTKIKQFHPDKQNGDEELAKRLINANRVLTNDILRRNYDISQDDAAMAEPDERQREPGDYPELPFGRKKSDLYAKLIAAWQTEYQTLDIQDNYFEEMCILLSDIEAKHDLFKCQGQQTNNQASTGYHCDICKLDFENEAHHYSEIVDTYIYYLTEGRAWDECTLKNGKEAKPLKSSVYTKFLEMMDEDKWTWEPFK